MIVDGVRYAHLLDPRSGWPVTGPRSVSVLASHCLIAGTTSSIAMLSGTDAPRWLDAVGLPHVRVERDGRVFERWELLDSARLERPRASAASSPAGARARSEVGAGAES
jgi:thiamine biosynthesis lipoprotein ApbE